MWVTDHSPCEFIHDLYVAEIYRPGAVFSADDNMSPSSFTSTQPAPEKAKVVRYGRSNFKVIEIGTRRKPIWNILLAFHYKRYAYLLLLPKHSELLVENLCCFAVFNHFSLV